MQGLKLIHVSKSGHCCNAGISNIYWPRTLSATNLILLNQPFGNKILLTIITLQVHEYVGSVASTNMNINFLIRTPHQSH